MKGFTVPSIFVIELIGSDVKVPPKKATSFDFLAEKRFDRIANSIVFLISSTVGCFPR
jgi:hypothetical protein